MINKDFRYRMPTQIIFGIDKVDTIADYVGDKKTLLVTSGGWLRRGLVDRIKSLTDSVVVAVCTDVKSHPEFKDLEKTYKDIHQNEFEQIFFCI